MDLLFGVIFIVCGGLVFVIVMLCITWCSFYHLKREERAG